MMNPDEALLWARDAVVRFWSKTDPDFCREVQAGFWDDSDRVKWRVQAYRAGAAASEARIKALEAEVRELKEALTATVMQATARQIPITNEIKFSAPIRAEMKEADQ